MPPPRMPKPPPPRAAAPALPPRPELVQPLPSKRDMAAARAAKKKKENDASLVGPSKRKTFGTRAQLIMYMDIAGETTADIALKLTMHPASVSAIKGSPLYQVNKQKLLEQLAGLKFTNLLDLIKHDAIKNVEAAIEIRDTAYENNKDRLGAIRVLQKEADRVWPRQTKHTEERIVRITLDGEKMRRIGTVLHEIGARSETGDTITAEDVVELDMTANDGTPVFEAKSIDEARAALLARADSALND